MNNTLSIDKKIDDLRRRLPRLEELAEAELALVQATGKSEPLTGSCVRRDEALDALRVLERTKRGQAIRAAMTRLHDLDKQLAEIDAQRQAQDRKVAEMTTNPVIARWVVAQRVANQVGWGASWELYANWLTSHHNQSGAPECLTFFQSNQCIPRLRFSVDKDRATVKAYCAAKGESFRLLTIRDSIAGQRSLLLLSHPELVGAA